MAWQRTVAGMVLAGLLVLPLHAQKPATALDTATLDSGRIAGTRAGDGAVAAFKGLPYAAPPVGPLRLAAPAPVQPWRGVRRADRFGDVCPQPGKAPEGLAMSEDCLTANVWTAARSVKERRPVFVWIYGGGFSGGTAANPQFDGESLARQGVVVVTFNYRLGPLGFLATPELSRESGHGASGNYGILDDVALLKWVRRNIAAFGGDPARVTIGGQSAGAGSVGFLAMSPLAKGLFLRAIAESHVRHPGDSELRYLSTSWRPLAQAERAGTAYAEAHGARTAADLRALPWQALLEGGDAWDEGVDTGSTAKPPLFRPVVDGWVIPHGYADTLRNGTQNRVFYLAGNNKDETGAVPDTAIAALRARPPALRGGMPPTSVTLSAYRAWAARRFGPLADEFLRLYPASTDDEAAAMNNQASRDNSRVSTFLWTALWKRSVASPVYTYTFTHARPGPDAAMRGAFHGAEISYVFDSLDKTPQIPWTAEDRRIARTMSGYWANYIKAGNPNGPGLPAWPAWSANRRQVMELGDHFAPMPIATPARAAFWQRYFEGQRQW